MPEADKDSIQRQILKTLARLKRSPFRRSIALRISLTTTDKVPTHSHHIAKNLLDLFGARRSSVPGRGKSVLYSDDSQVAVLGVTCQHGGTAPSIQISACPLGGLLIDLEHATRWASEHGDEESRRSSEARFDDDMDEFNDLRKNGDSIRRRIGDSAYEGFLNLYRRQIQERLLGYAAIRPKDLAAMYNTAGRTHGVDLAAMFDIVFSASPLRIRLSELPQVHGSSETWRKEIDEKVHAFKKRFAKLIDPWLVPVALDVLIKPPADSRAKATHDLDNVVRSYLLPKITEILKPVSDLSFTFDREAMRQALPELRSSSVAKELLHTPPASTKIGVSRYEVWRLPPALGNERGFVSLAVVADSNGVGDGLRQTDAAIVRWHESLVELV